MTSVNFYFNVPDKTLLLTQLLQKILHQHRKATVFVESESEAAALNEALWVSNKTSFLANAMPHDAFTHITPIVIDWHAKGIFQDDVLVNFQARQITFFSRFKQLIEIVGMDEVDKVMARQRFAFYRDRGYEIKRIDMLKKSI